MVMEFHSMSRPHARRFARHASIVAAAMSLRAVSGCGAAGKEFRSIAGPAVQQGVSSIVNGLLDGVFAVVDPNTTGNSTSGN